MSSLVFHFVMAAPDVIRGPGPIIPIVLAAALSSSEEQRRGGSKDRPNKRGDDLSHVITGLVPAISIV
ncbi:hypothetical protein [Microvirga lotononidis]|uniref:hypothetical protein n=1 Tax=Microvirga lotononidis TaxID=864069 RepID=UPI0002D4C360|nr:hypothetical protein [Microvirga lotononidis]WQO28861.1 hypothetical protein U0023_07240 [Microvirga lotononidis]